MEGELLNIIKRTKLSYFGHVMRKEGDCLEKEIMQCTTPGARKQGKPRMRWMDNMEELTGMPFEDQVKSSQVKSKSFNRSRETEESGVDVLMKRPTLGSRMVEDKTRQVPY